MVAGLITLPVRLTLGAAGLLWRGVESASAHAIAFVQRARSKDGTSTQVDESEIYAGPPPPTASITPEEPEPLPTPRRGAGDRRAPTATAARAPKRAADERPVVPQAPPTGEPTHVSEEPELVEELAEPGAEEGAGAQVNVREPWEGYGRMNARDVVARLAAADPAELAAIELYERAHRNRRTVLNALGRRLAR